jgi:hypothetical protein
MWGNTCRKIKLEGKNWNLPLSFFTLARYDPDERQSEGTSQHKDIAPPSARNGQPVQYIRHT